MRCLLVTLLTFTFIGRVATSKQYTIEELNSIVLPLSINLTEYSNNAFYQQDLYRWIANVTTENCTAPKISCTLEPKYSRTDRNYARTISTDDYTYTGELIREIAQPSYTTANDPQSGTSIYIYLTTFTTYDYLAWTDMVRILYYKTPDINTYFKDQYNIDAFISGPPTSYAMKLIDADSGRNAGIIAGVLLGLALIMFAIVVPLSNTRFCHKSDGEEDDEQQKEKEKEKEKETGKGKDKDKKDKEKGSSLDAVERF